jgi:hypothetical protein
VKIAINGSAVRTDPMTVRHRQGDVCRSSVWLINCFNRL